MRVFNVQEISHLKVRSREIEGGDTKNIFEVVRIVEKKCLVVRTS
jgi:hypothetical protein